MKDAILLGILIISIALLSGCTNIEKDPLIECSYLNSGFEVYVGSTSYHNCTLSGNGCASSSGCTFRDCTELNPGDYIHSNEYVKRCP